MRTRFLVFALLIWLPGLVLRAGELEAKIQKVENGLRPAIALKGEPPAKMSIAERMQHYKVPGVSVAVIAGGKVEWVRGYGTTARDGGKPVTPQTLFQAASISKSVAALVVMRLVEQGKLSLDEDVNLKLRSWKVPENEFTKTEKVTLRRLLNHSAGLTVHGFGGYAKGEPVPTLVEVLDGKKPANSAPVRVDIEPGTKGRYSGGGYEVMQLLVQDVTGKPFAQVARELILEPLGMKLSTYEQPLPLARAGEAAAGHIGDGSALPGAWHTYPEQAAAGLWTTPSDLARMILEVQSGGHILKSDSINTVLTKLKDNYGLGFGLSDREGRVSFAHGGSNAGFRCQFFGYRDSGDGAVIMTNSDNGSPLANEILRSLSAEYGWASYKQEEKVLATVDAPVLQAYVGDYQFPDGPLVQVTFEDGRLFATLFGRKSQLLPESNERFFTLEGGVPPFQFARDPGGTVELHADGNIAKRVKR